MKLPLLLFCVVFMTLNNVVVHTKAVANPGLTPPGPSSTDDIPSARATLLRNPQIHALNSDNTQEAGECGDLNDDCSGCLHFPNCSYLKFNNSETTCVKLPGGIENYKPEDGVEVLEYINDVGLCPVSDKDVTPRRISPKFSTGVVTESANTNTTTASTSTSTTAKTTPKTTSDTTVSTTTTTVTTTTSVTTSTTKPSPPSTTSTTTKTPSTTSVPTTTSKTTPVPQPDPRGGSNFDGWSFFGGILLTVGIAAIGFISFKYYKVRAGGQHNAGANYNRF